MNSNPTGISLLRLETVKLKTGLARSTIYKLVSTGEFPLPVKLTGKAIAWASNEVDLWIASRMSARGRAIQ